MSFFTGTIFPDALHSYGGACGGGNDGVRQKQGYALKQYLLFLFSKEYMYE